MCTATASVIIATRRAAHVIELRVLKDLKHGDGRQAVLILATRAPMHPHWLLRCMLVHIGRLSLLVEAGQHLLLIHIRERRLHSILTVAIHLILPEVHQSFIHVVAIRLMIIALIHLLIEYHVWSIRRH